jgi:hypothetical protein
LGGNGIANGAFTWIPRKQALRVFFQILCLFACD